MIKTPILLQDLRRKIYQQAKLRPEHRFGRLYVHLFKESTLEEAYRQVRASAGAAGIDGVTFENIERGQGKETFLKSLRQSLQQKTYHPNFNRRVEIPRANGKTRTLGIPTIIERVVQAAIKLIIEPIFEANFQPGSFGYRPGKKAGDAIFRLQKALLCGRCRIIDLDLKDYFNTVRHDLLLKLLANKIQDGELLRLIRLILRASGKPGVPQGGVLSPLFSKHLSK